MNNAPTKIVKGGFRATLALLISIIALVLSVMAYQRTMTQEEYQAEIKALSEKLLKMKQETSERVNKLREETSKAIKNIGIEIKRKEDKTENSQSQ